MVCSPLQNGPKNSPKNGPKNGPKNSPKNSPVHILPYAETPSECKAVVAKKDCNATLSSVKRFHSVVNPFVSVWS